MLPILASKMASFTVSLTGDEAARARAEGLLPECAEKRDAVDNTTSYRCYCLKGEWEAILEALAKKLSAVSDLEFLIHGSARLVDETHVDFRLTCHEGEAILQFSRPYVVMCADEYDDYEDFCLGYCDKDGKPMYTVSQYVSFLDGLRYVIDGDYTNVAETVYLAEERILDLK